MQHRALAAAIVLAAPSAWAQPAPKFEFGKSEEVEKVKVVEWTAQAEAGIVFTTGNAETTTVSAGLKASRKTGFNKLSIEGSMTYAKSGTRVLVDNNGNGMIDDESEITTVDTTTAETYAAKLRYDRFLTKFNSLFVAALASRDKPAGKEKALGFQVGYSRQIYKTEKAEAVAEIGYDFSREDLTAGKSLSIHSARVFLGSSPSGASMDSSSCPSRWSISTTSCSVTLSRSASSLGVTSNPWLVRRSCSWRSLKKSFRWASVVPSFTIFQLSMM